MHSLSVSAGCTHPARDHRSYAAPESCKTNHHHMHQQEQHQGHGDEKMEGARRLLPAQQIDARRNRGNKCRATSPGPSKSPMGTGRKSRTGRPAAAARYTTRPPPHSAARTANGWRSCSARTATKDRLHPEINFSENARSTPRRLRTATPSISQSTQLESAGTGSSRSGPAARTRNPSAPGSAKQGCAA